MYGWSQQEGLHFGSVNYFALLFLDNRIFLCLFVLPISLNLEIHSTSCFAKITSWIALNFQFCRYFSRVVTTPFTYWKYMMSILYPTFWNKHFHSRTNTSTIMIVGVITAETDSTVSLEFSRKEFMKRAWLPVTTNFLLRFFVWMCFITKLIWGGPALPFCSSFASMHMPWKPSWIM